MISWLADHDAFVVAAQLGAWLVLFAVTGRAVYAESRPAEPLTRGALVALAVFAALVSLVWFPAFSRFEPLGHEASYADCFTGAASPATVTGWHPYVTYPVLRWSYWALGGLVGRDHLGALLVVNALIRGATVLAVGALARSLFRSDRTAVLAALLLAVHPTHAFWGASIFNVALPILLATLCMLQAVVAWQTGDRLVLAAGAASGCLVVATRVEFGLLAPALAVLLFLGLDRFWGRHAAVSTPRFWGAAVAVLVPFAVTLFVGAGELTSQGGYHDPMGYVETVGRQLGLLALLEPLDRPWALAAAALGAVACVRAGERRLALGLFGFFLVAWCGLATFNDFAYRHAMLPSLAVLLLVARAADWVLGPSAGKPPVAAAVGALLLATVGASLLLLPAYAARYHATVEEYVAAAPAFSGRALAPEEIEGGGCYLITDNERLWERGLAGSHFNLMEPGEAASHWRDHDGCILWLRDFGEHRLDGLVVRSRALKLDRWFSWEVQGFVRFPDGLDAAVLRMSAPPWGLTEPPADWRWAPDGGEGSEPDLEPGVESG